MSVFTVELKLNPLAENRCNINKSQRVFFFNRVNFKKFWGILINLVPTVGRLIQYYRLIEWNEITLHYPPSIRNVQRNSSRFFYLFCFNVELRNFWSIRSFWLSLIGHNRIQMMLNISSVYLFRSVTNFIFPIWSLTKSC